MLLTARTADGSRVGLVETRLFRTVNGLPDSLYKPAWVLMQCGALGAAPVAAELALLSGRPVTAVRVLAGGTGAWALAKVVKRLVGRPRPAHVISGTCIRGREESGLGYPSGHTAVATVLASALADGGGGPHAVLAVGLVTAVAGARMYVGAHLPLDVAGGAFLGVAVDGVVAGLAAWRTGCLPPQPSLLRQVSCPSASD